MSDRHWFAWSPPSHRNYSLKPFWEHKRVVKLTNVPIVPWEVLLDVLPDQQHPICHLPEPRHKKESRLSKEQEQLPTAFNAAINLYHARTRAKLVHFKVTLIIGSLHH